MGHRAADSARDQLLSAPATDSARKHLVHTRVAGCHSDRFFAARQPGRGTLSRFARRAPRPCRSPPLRMTYLRFVVGEVDPDSGRELGVFHAVLGLRENGELDPHEEEQHDRIRKWFNDHLEKPTRFTASKPPFYRKKKKAISWFKDTAQEHLARMRLLVAILQNHGVSVRML